MDRRITRLGLAAAATAAFVISAQTGAKGEPAADPAGVQWQRDLRAAHRLAVATHRPLLLVFGTTSCTHCRVFEKNTLGDPVLANFVNAEFVPVYLNYEKNRRVADVLEVTSFPTSVVLNSDADLLGSVVGCVNRTECHQFLSKALETQRFLRDSAALVSGRVVR